MSRVRLRNESLVWSEVGEETVVLELDSSTYFTVKGSGTLIVRLLAEGASEDSLVQSLTDAYEVDVATARADVERFLKELADVGMLETLDQAL